MKYKVYFRKGLDFWEPRLDLDIEYSIHAGDTIKVGKEIWQVHSTTVDMLLNLVNVMVY